MGTQAEETLEPKTGRSRQAFDRLLALLSVTTELASALGSRRVAEVVVENGVCAVGAQVGGVWLTCGDDAWLMRSVGLSEAAQAEVAVLPVSTPGPVTAALRDRKTTLIGSNEEFAARFPEVERRVRSLGVVPGAVACMPMVAEDRVVGGLMVGWRGPHTFDRDDVTYLEILAGHAALAFDRTRLFDDERRSRAHVEVLYRLASAVTRARSLEEIFEHALDAVCRGLPVDRASIVLLDETRTALRFRASRGLSEAYRRAVEGHPPWTAAAVDAAPIFVPDVQAEPSLQAFGAIFAAEGIRALAFVPLLHEGTLLGRLMIYAREPRVFTEDDAGMAAAVATHTAQAVARWSAVEAVVRAKAAAEAAAAARESLLATVAHDLRNPLGVAQLKSQMMLRRLPAGELGEKLKRDLETIHRNTLQMARLINDLVDVAAIETRRLSVERAFASAADIVNEALELARPLVEQKRLELTSTCAPGLPEICCDRQRVIQVLSNLIGNAIKFAPEESAIAIEAARDGAGVRFCVSDEGPGIPLEDRERVFEQWTSGKRKGGIGLGLFISRGLVHAHGGRIWIESNRDASGVERGARVSFTIPIGGGESERETR